MNLENGKLITSTRNDDKIRNDGLKSSNNGITKCLQERYISINQNYNNVKIAKIISKTLSLITYIFLIM